MANFKEVAEDCWRKNPSRGGGSRWFGGFYRGYGSSVYEQDAVMRDLLACVSSGQTRALA